MNKARLLALTTSSHIVLDVLTSAIRQEKEIKQCLVTDDIIVYVENSMESTKSYQD